MVDEICHWNLNGLKCKQSPNYYGKINQISSILENSATLALNLQETHISAEKELPNFVETYKHLYDFQITFSPANDTSSGILLCIRKTEKVMVSEVLENGRLLYVKIKNEANESFKHIFSIYCNPSDSIKQKALIAKLRDRINRDNINLDSCLILGDFNFVTSILDRNGSKMNRTDIETSRDWNNFEDQFNLQDTFRLTNPTRRLYTLIFKANNKIKSRIDRVYCSQDLSGKILSSSFTITNLSDHKILKVKMATKIEKGNGLWIFNNLYLNDQSYCREIEQIASNFVYNQNDFSDYRHFWDAKKQIFINFSKNYIMEKNKEKHFLLYKYQKEYEDLESIHQTKLTVPILERSNFLKNKIDEAQKEKITGSLLRTKIPNFEETDPNITYLNRLEKRKGEENTIYCLLNQENTLVNSSSEIKNVIHNFYKNLYTKEPEDEHYQEEFLEAIDAFISDEDKVMMDTQINETDLYTSLKNMKDNKTPGPDGLTKEWYFHFWNFIKGDLLECTRVIENTGELTEMQKRGGVKISYKKGDRKLIKNYRPITLLNIDLKIITKTLADRLIKVIPSIIHHNQTCVPGRHIENNIFLTQDLIDHANLTNRNLAIIFLDQEKAFDRMSHEFILKTLERFGFGKYFIKWVKTICCDTKSFVKVNGFQTFEFNIERGVRQGCPLSPLLYVLAAETLSSAIRKNVLIKGYTYKMHKLYPLQHKISQYADDTSIAVTDIVSINELFKTLDKYQKATNAKVNKDKTEGLWVGSWRERQDTPLNLKWTSETINFLGIIIGNKVGSNGHLSICEKNFAEQIEKIKNKMNFWKGKGLTLFSRVKVINVFILSRLWYRTNVCDIPKNMLELLNRMVRNFVWEDKQGARVRQEVLQLEYTNGGLQLVDIYSKMQVQRTKRILGLIKMNPNNFERFLADELVGNYTKHRQYGLSYGLLNNKIRILAIKNEFYRNALRIICELDIILKPSNINTIQEEPLFHNSAFRDPVSNGPFKLTRFKNQMPKNVKNLLNFQHSREQEINETVRKLRQCINSIHYTQKGHNELYVSVNNEGKNINELDFKNLYLLFLNKINVNKEWEMRWENYLNLRNIDWKPIWKRIHTIDNYYITSAFWEMFHLNYWSNYRANEKCKLCNEIENNITHIICDCKMIDELMHFFNINQIYDNKLKIAFGQNTHNIDNLIFGHIKSVIFRSRFELFPNYDTCKKKLIQKCKNNLIRDLRYRFKMAKIANKIQEFKDKFLSLNRNSFWSLNIQLNLVFEFPSI